MTIHFHLKHPNLTYRVLRFLAAVLAFAGLSSGAPAQPNELRYDIVINGGSFSSPAAALQAARTNPEAEILLLEPTDWLGGQATSQGVAAIDNAWHEPGRSLMEDNPETYYPADYIDFLDNIKNAPESAPGDGYGGDGASWVTREAFDPRTAAWVLDEMIAEQSNITLMKMTVVKDVTTEAVSDAFGEGRKITSLRLVEREAKEGYEPFDDLLSEEILDWYDTADSDRFTKTVHEVLPREEGEDLVVIDASELADVIVLSDAVYTIGREKTTERLGEDGSLPEMDEDGSQAQVFTFAMTDAETPDPEEELKTPFEDFDSYYQEQANDFYSLSGYSWERIWTYRRLKNTGDPYSHDTVHRGDVSMQNWFPGNDYPYGNIYKNKANTEAETSDWKGGVILPDLAEMEKHAMGWYFYMKENRPTDWDTKYPRGDHPDNMMDTGWGLSKFPYIRGTRRIVGLHNFRLLGRYFVEVTGQSTTSFRFFDSVGIGNYAVDVHSTRISEGIDLTHHTPAPFYVPYRSLGSTNVRNLLAAGKTLATTFISNAGYRLHPIEWSIGSAAGGAAGLMAEKGATNYELLETSNLRELQNEVDGNSPISWEAYDDSPVPDKNGDMVINNFEEVRSGEHFDVEIYHHLGEQAEVFVEDNSLGETDYRANGRLVFNVESAIPSGTVTFKAVISDSEGNELDTLEKTIDVLPREQDASIIDDADEEFSTTGDWTSASSQPDRWAETYHYTSGGSGANSATFDFSVSQPGNYEVAIWYPAAFNRATDSPFTVHHANGQDTFRINQQENGGQWNTLGSFQFGGGGSVVLSDDTSDPASLVVADAVRLTLVSAALSGWLVR